MADGLSKANQRQYSKRKQRYEPYRLAERREINKTVKLIRHLERYPDDECAQKALESLPITARRRGRELLEKRRGLEKGALAEYAT